MRIAGRSPDRMRSTVALVSVAISGLLPACGGGRIFAGPTVAGANLLVEPELARLENGTLTALLEISNRSEEEVRVQLSRIVLIDPDGIVHTSAEDGGEIGVARKRRRRVRVRFTGLDRELEHAPGLVLRLDGFARGGEPLPLPPLPLGHPLAGTKSE